MFSLFCIRIAQSAPRGHLGIKGHPRFPSSAEGREIDEIRRDLRVAVAKIIRSAVNWACVAMTFRSRSHPPVNVAWRLAGAAGFS